MNTIIPLHYFEALNLPMNKKKKIVSKPIFPEFKKLEIEDREWMDEYIQPYPPYSDFNLVRLWRWNVDEKAEISLYKDNLIIKFFDYITSEPFYTFMGRENIGQTIRFLFDLIHREKFIPQIRFIPELVLKKKLLNHSRYQIRQDRDNFDYIFDLKTVAEMRGLTYKKKRWAYHKFIRDNPVEVIVLNQLKTEVKKNIIKFFNKWIILKNLSRKEYINELTALKRCLNLTDLIKLDVLICLKDKEIVAFSINQQISQNYAIGHFAKADTKYTKIWDYLFVTTSMYYYQQGIKLLNLQQDLGIEGLRIAKESWHPSSFLKKYTIEEL